MAIQNQRIELILFLIFIEVFIRSNNKHEKGKSSFYYRPAIWIDYRLLFAFSINMFPSTFSLFSLRDGITIF